MIMSAERRTEILERLNTLDASPTEGDRRAAREATIRKAVQTAEALAREGRSAGCGASSVGLPLTVNEHSRTPPRELRRIHPFQALR